MTLRAPAKLNLCLYLGPRREDGLHELRSVFCPLTLADRLVVEEAEEDEVVCPGVGRKPWGGRGYPRSTDRHGPRWQPDRLGPGRF